MYRADGGIGLREVGKGIKPVSQIRGFGDDSERKRDRFRIQDIEIIIKV